MQMSSLLDKDRSGGLLYGKGTKELAKKSFLPYTHLSDRDARQPLSQGEEQCQLAGDAFFSSKNATLVCIELSEESRV